MLTAPSVQQTYNGTTGDPLSSFTSLSSTYAETMNATAGTDAEAMYDLWLNGLDKEVMFWVDNHGQTPAGNVVGTYSFGGATWNLWANGSGYWAFVREGNASSGTVDLLAGLKDLDPRRPDRDRQALADQFRWGDLLHRRGAGGLPGDQLFSDIVACRSPVSAEAPAITAGASCSLVLIRALGRVPWVFVCPMRSGSVFGCSCRRVRGGGVAGGLITGW